MIIRILVLLVGILMLGSSLGAQTIPSGCQVNSTFNVMLCPVPVAPTPTPTPGITFTNAQDPPLTFTPYSPKSVWNTPVSSNPTYLSNSASLVKTQFPSGVDITIRANEAGQYDYNHPRYFASNTDPVVTIQCTLYCGAPENGGVPATIHIPAKARPAGGSDAHFDVVQPDGTEISMWYTSQPTSNWTTGSVLTAGNIANCGSYTTGQGWLPSGPGPTAAGYCDNAGMITAAEMIAGQINHALFVVGPCAIGSQFPSESTATTDRCTSGVGPPLGGRMWYDVPCTTTQASTTLKTWEKGILCALNKYGGYLADDTSGAVNFTGFSVMTESEEPWYAFNGPSYTSPFAPLASQGWNTITIPNAIGTASGTRWVGADPWTPSGVNFASHIHWLAPCSAQGTC